MLYSIVTLLIVFASRRTISARSARFYPDRDRLHRDDHLADQRAFRGTMWRPHTIANAILVTFGRTRIGLAVSRVVLAETSYASCRRRWTCSRADEPVHRRRLLVIGVLIAMTTAPSVACSASCEHATTSRGSCRVRSLIA